MKATYISNKRRYSKEIKSSSNKSQKKKAYYSSEEESITEENIEEKNEIKCIPSQIQDNNQRNKRIEFRRQEIEQLDKSQKILETLNELKSSVESLRKDNLSLNLKVFNLENDHKTMKSEKEAFKKIIEDDHKIICTLKKEGKDVQQKICLLEKEGKNAKQKICSLEKERVFLQDQIDELKMKKDIDKECIYKLEEEIKSLSSYAFSGELRKLLKNLLGYLIKYFKENMIYDIDQSKLFFIKSPYSKNDIDSVNALNLILDIIFSQSTKSDRIIHYVNRKATINKAFIKNITIFENAKAFFDYFSITEKDGNILLKYIPERYFTTIDNANFKYKLLSKLME